MLPKSRRIPRQLFPRILTLGKRYNSPSLLLYVSLAEANAPSRFAFSVSKKVAKKAVDRNRFRRRGYSAVSKHLANVKPGFLFFFSFKKGSSGLKFAALEKEILDLLRAALVLS